MNLTILRRTAAEIAAAAVYETYPDVELLGGGETDIGFFYECYIPHPVQLEVIEEKIRQIIREKRAIRTLEMVAFSAAELLRSQGHHHRAEELEEGIVEIIQIGSFHDLSPGPHLKNSAELAAFKISLEPLPHRRLKVVGWCHSSKEALKQFLKKLQSYTDPSVLGEKRGYWKGSIWLPEGLRLRQLLIHFLKKQWFEGAYEISAPQEGDRLTIHRSLGKGKVAEIVDSSLLQISFFNQPEEEMISCLQLIAKTLTILGFDHSVVSMGQQTDYEVEDGLERKHSLVQVKRIPRKGSRGVDFYWTARIGRIFPLLLEKNLILQMVELENQ